MTIQLRLIHMAAVICTMSSSAVSQEHDPSRRDTLGVVTSLSGPTEYRVSVGVSNDQGLAGLDIPLRFGSPGARISLVRVEWSERVMNCDFKHAEIDNSNKTVIIGLIAELGGARPDPDLAPVGVQDPTVATLVFKVEGDQRPEMSTFTMDEPHHSLTFLYNTLVDSVLTVREFTPEFKVSEADE